MSGLDTLNELRALARARSRESFCARVTVPVLLVEASVEVPEEQRFTTLKGEVNYLATYEALLEVKKVADRNAFSTMVTIGRAANNDLILDAGGVSKFHAYFISLNEGWALVDAGSSFGTCLNGRALEPRTERAQLRDQDELRFGNGVTARYLSPKACYEFFRAGAGSGSGRIR